ncbi:MAG: amino acid transporter [Spirochaetaceae bacterium]|nr:amino acid transporter [Spirochaetaceae bacterium]
MNTFISALLLGLSLILAIGAQNAFVLKQGLKKQYVFMICLICGLSDAILITLGVSGFGVIIQKFPLVITFSKYGGFLFLTIYAIRSIYSSITKTETIDTNTDIKATRVKSALICLALTWLNPHVYLDTVILLGSVSTQFPEQKLQFTLGAISASFIFFFSLGYGSRFLTPLFKKPKSWKVLDFIIGIIMLSIAIKLLLMK